MKQPRPYPVSAVTLKAQRSIESGHPWIYDTEVVAPPVCEDGDLVDVTGPRGAYLGTGFYNSRSKIRIRLISSAGGKPCWIASRIQARSG